MLPALRGDLIINKQKYEGRTYYVIKDPVSLQYFRMSGDDYYLATLFDGRKTFGRIRDMYARQFPHVRLEYTPEELNERVLRFANDLALMQFLTVQGQRLKARYEAQKKQKKKRDLLQSRQQGLLQPLFGVRSGSPLRADGEADRLDLDANLALDLGRGSSPPRSSFSG